jgi:chitinase
VGHDAHISYIDLRKGQVIKTLDVTADVHDVVLADNGWVYASPKQDQWEKLRAVEIATNTEVQSTGNSIRAGSVYKLHPGGQSLYGADRGLSPSDIEKIDISAGAPAYAYDSPYHGDYPMCGDLWLSEDGQRIFTACGNVFRTSSNREKDMTYNGKLSRLTRIQHIVHSSQAQRILALPKADRRGSKENLAENSLVIFEYETLNTEAIITLPDFVVNNNSYASQGRFVFINSIGSEYYVIVEADEESGLLHGFGLIKQSFE